MREILLSRGVQPRLGPETEEEAYEEIQAMERIMAANDFGGKWQPPGACLDQRPLPALPISIRKF